MNILILCTGNSCRSQMAHGFLQSLDPGINVYSAGTRPARQVNRLAVEVMAEAGIDIGHHTPTDVSRYRNDPWDYVVTVCSHADRNCPAFAGNVGKRLHIGFDDPSEAQGSPEYIYQEFRRVRDEIKQAFTSLYFDKIAPRLRPAGSDSGQEATDSSTPYSR